jgi:hypothetical protein
MISGAGQDVSPRYGSSNALMDYGSVDFHSSGIVRDGRTAYVFDQAHGSLYSFNLDQWPFALNKVLDLGAEAVYTDAGRGVTIVWHPELRAIVIGTIFGKLYAYEVDSRKLTKWNRPDGFTNGLGHYVQPSTMFYDPDSRDIVSIGGIDWDTEIASINFWRLHVSP